MAGEKWAGWYGQGVVPWGVVTSDARELRVRQLEMVGGHCRTRKRAGRVGNYPIEWIRDMRHERGDLVGAVLFHLGAEVVKVVVIT